jgi:aminoglycoside/choline kinase family phosphotransferase
MSLAPASADASFRRYFRLQTRGKSFIAMDAPPPEEDCLPFVRIAGFLEAMNLNAPRVIEADMEQGFLLLSDLGSIQYLEHLESRPADADDLYGDAIVALRQMQRAGAAYQSMLPPYDVALLERELSLFREWLCGTHLELQLSADDLAAWQDCCECLVQNALDQPTVFVHRDYHSRNLMLTDADNPGILDFQDAVEGPLTYDLVSLLKDCYVRWPDCQVDSWARLFYSELSDALQARVSPQQFRRYFDLMGVQRHLKAAGIFARLKHRDGKAAYLDDIPLTLSYIVDLQDRYPELSFLVSLLRERVLPGLEQRA